jgi:hypothetical protein
MQAAAVVVLHQLLLVVLRVLAAVALVDFMELLKTAALVLLT